VNMKDFPLGWYSTYSIVARDPDTGSFGAAVQTHQMCVGAVVPWLDPGAGAVVTQAMTNVNFGPRGLDLLRGGFTAQQVLDALLASDERRQTRQVAIVDSEGSIAVWTGEECIREAGHFIGNGYSVQANMMMGDTVIDAMKAAYEADSGDMADRLLGALQEAQREGGDIRGMQSAALKIVSAVDKRPASFQLPSYDLRVDEHHDPVGELDRLVRLRKAQLINARGHKALEDGEIERAREEWAEARKTAPELEEIPFWQSIDVLEEIGDLEWAAEIFQSAFSSDERHEEWIDLIHRLEECGIITRDGAAQDLEDAILAI
jgi:uncharacterized Ntn-hydrolase superfamily protein